MQFQRIGALAAALALGCVSTFIHAADLPQPGTTKILGMNVHTADPTLAELNLIKNGGWSMVRMDINWNRVETVQGQYNFDYGGQWPVNVLYDNWSTQLGKQNLFILNDVVATNPIYGAKWSQTWQDGFVNFAAAVAAKWKGSNNIYEILNEPFNDPVDPSYPPGLYTNLAHRVSQAMRAIDPDVKIIGPAVSPLFAPNYLRQWFWNGLLNDVDAISLHPYTYNQAPEQIVSMYADVRSWMQQYGGKVIPIVSSEAGWYTTPATNGVSPQTQADYLTRYNLINMSQNIYGSVEYQFRDYQVDPNDPESNYGVMATASEPTLADAKPAYFAMQELAQNLNGKTFSTKLDDGNSNNWLLLFTAPGGVQTLAYWTAGADQQINLPGWGDLNLTSTPQYITVPEPGGILLLSLGAGLMGLGRRGRHTSNI